MNNQPYPPNQPNQGHQQREMTDQPYPFSPPHQGYQHLPDSSGPVYQPPPYHGNQVPFDGQNYGPSDDMVRMSDMGAMQAESHYATYRDPMGNLVESRQQVFEDQNQIRANIRYWTSTILNFLLGVLEIILLLRFIFRLLGANKDTSFITFLYGLSHPFVVAFNGIFNDQTLGRVGVFELSTLIAMLIYALLVWGLIALVKVIFAPVQTSRQSFTTTRRSQY